MLKEVKLKILMGICILVGISNLMPSIQKPIGLFCLVLHFLLVLSAKEEDFLPILLFNHTCSGLYDKIGFQYLFNFTIFIFIIKFVIHRKKLNIHITGLLILLFMYNILISILVEYLKFSDFPSIISLFCSYIFIVFLSNNIEKIDIKKCFIYFFYGFVFSAISSMTVPITTWGTSKIPTAYRFCGYLRDPNYFSIDALLVMITSLMFYKKINKYYFIIFIIGIFSISKMFLLLSFTITLLYLLISLFNKNKKVFSFTILALLCIPFLFMIFSETQFYQLILNKFLYRFEKSNLTTGRFYLQSYYIQQLFYRPFSFIFGSSLNYRFILGLEMDKSLYYYGYGVHNTYLDILLSWGFLGSTIYIFMIYNLYKNIIKDKKKIIFECKILVFVVLIMLFALSYLNVDFFAILIFYTFFCIRTFCKEDNESKIIDKF